MIFRLIVFAFLLPYSFHGISQGLADTNYIKAHFKAITKTKAPRNHKNIDELNRVANYLFNEFSAKADSTYFQEYQVNGKTYKNVIAIFGKQHEKTIVVGAHYDVCDNQEGADDNASGTIGLLEIARLLETRGVNHRIELVAYTLEEPPYFRSEFMGSHIHAKSLIDHKVDVYGMVCLEMIGYFDERKKTQDYPLGILSWFYGSKGDYITLVNKFGKGQFARRFNRSFKKPNLIETKKFVGPKWLQGIDFSDHLNYWKYKMSAVMITDTAFYRNKNYHKNTDKMETLDFQKMAKVIDTTLLALLNMK